MRRPFREVMLPKYPEHKPERIIFDVKTYHTNFNSTEKMSKSCFVSVAVLNTALPQRNSITPEAGRRRWFKGLPEM